MFKAILMSLMIQTAQAQEPEPSTTIVVEAHKDYEVYVAPIVMNIHSKEVEAVVSEKSVFGYTSSYWKNAKVKNERGAWEPITMHSDLKVYDKDTIKYAWPDCDYIADAKGCAYKNNHMVLETHITVDDHEIVVLMMLYGSDMTLINQSTYTSRSRINWIKQQEITVNQQQGLLGSSTTIHKPKEELPLKWLIPTNLLDKHIWQASMLLWTGTRISD